MTENQEQYELAVRDPVLVPSWALMREQATVLHKSGFFPKSIQCPEAALAIMLAGRELGIGPMESLRSIYIVDGQTTISSGLMAAMIWDAGHAYNIDESTDTACQITFKRSNGQSYTHRFTHEDAKKAGLTGRTNWQKYEKAMLFNRCLSAGGRVFMPDVFRRMYTPEEMGAPVTVSESGDVVIDVEATVVEDEPKGGEPERIIVNGKWTKIPERPWKPAQLKEILEFNVSKSSDTGEPSQGMIGLLAGKLEEAWPGDKGAADNRHEVLGWLTGKRSAKELSRPWLNALLTWLLAKDSDAFNEHSREEARLVYKQAMLDQGQTELPIGEAAKAPQQHSEDLFGGRSTD